MSAVSPRWNSVEIRLRLSGYLAAIHFIDGQMVKKGDLLFTIDRRPFQIVLEQMRANLAQARANLAFTEADLAARPSSAFGNKTITEQAYDQRTQAKRVAEAAVAAQEAMVHSAELDLEQYSELRSPIDGRIGDRRVAVGNLITGGAGGATTLLATIVSVDPIRFEFSFDEASYLRYVRFATSSQDVASLRWQCSGHAQADRREGLPAPGQDRFRRQRHRPLIGHHPWPRRFDNADGRLTPGMFGRVQIHLRRRRKSAAFARSAIGTEQVRNFVYVVGDDNVATRRGKYVTLGQLSDGLRVVKYGCARRQTSSSSTA